MALRTDEERENFAERGAVWVALHVTPLAAAIREFAGTVARGNPPPARKWLKPLANEADAVARAALGGLIDALVRQQSLTAAATTVARTVAKVCNRKLRGGEETVQVGMWLVSCICDTTGAARIEAKHADRPEKVAGGVKVVIGYELVPADGKFLEDAAEFGALGMPTYTLDAPQAWTTQRDGGTPEHAGGMVHRADKAMAGVSHNTAPALFDAVNHAQAAPFRVNPVSASLVLDYDAGAAFDWLLRHYLAAGMEPDAAEREAREAARL
jgi:hypothetical protein